MTYCEHCGAQLDGATPCSCQGATAARAATTTAPDAAARTEAPPAPPAFTLGDVSRLAERIADESVRRFAETYAGTSGVLNDENADIRAFRSLGQLIYAAGQPATTTTELRAFAHRALADQVTADSPGVMVASVLQDVKGILTQARPAVDAFGREPLTEAGMTLDWPYYAGTLSSLVGVQATQKSEITTVDVDIDKGTEAIATYAGGSDIAYQLIRRSSPAYLEAYGRIMLAAYALVTDNAFVDRVVALATGVEDIAGTWATRTEAQIRTALVSASMKVQDATGSPPGFVLAAGDVYTRIASTLVGQNRLELQATPRIIYEPNLATGIAIASNSTAASWHEDGPFQAAEEDVAKLGRNVAYWGMGAAGVYLPAGVVLISDATP